MCSSHLALLRQLTSALFPTAPARLLQIFRLRFACTPASQQTRSTYRTDGPRAATFLQNVAFFPRTFNEKRSSPLISAWSLSSEGLCSSHLALLRQLTSALFPTAPARLLQIFRLRFACTPASQQTRSTYRTDGPRAATFLQNVAFFPSHFNEKRSSPLISAGVQSSEGLCCSLLVLCTKRLPLYLPRTERLFTNLPAYASLTLQICKESL